MRVLATVGRRVARFGGVLLVAAVLILALIGFLHTTRGTAVRRVLGVGADGVPVAIGEPAFPHSVALLTGTPLVPGNRVDIALDGAGTYERLWHDLRSAKHSITLQIYYGKVGDVADTLGRILIERASAGVRVLMLYDAFGSQGIPRSRVETLRKAGVVVEPFRSVRFTTLHLAQNRSHVRGVVVDGRIGWTGGFGIDDKWLGDGRTNGAWRETNVRFEGPAVHQLEAAFAAAWAEATGVLVTGRTHDVVPVSNGELAGLLYATPSLGSTQAERFLALSIAGARKTLYITNAYFAPDQSFTTLLAGAAHRGVDVRILTAGPRTDIRTIRLAGRDVYDRLLDAGVRIYEWQPSTLHSKSFVADGIWSTVGSMNFDNRSLALNEESTLMVLDEQLGRRMNEIFFEDLKHAEEITKAAMARRSWLERIAGRLARLMTRLL